MTPRLEGKVAVVTGASKGIGRAYAERLAADGADVAIADRASAAETEAAVRALGRRVVSRALDVTDEAGVADFAADVADAFGRCDILVNNAGIYPFQPFDEMAFEDWRKVLTVDLDSVFLMCRAFAPGMKARGFGRIVNVSSAACWAVAPNSAHYQAAKMGVIGLTRGLASELGPHGVTANVIAPGMTRTGTTERDLSQYFETEAAASAMKRVAETDDLAGVVAFLASDDARFVTGQTVIVDGGRIRI
jgi:NAD(P)-dependent dehydrogenase (short-subunit alcohol dehydrogenase family)